MTNAEFRTWILEYYTQVPSCEAWVGRQRPDVQLAQLGSWEDALSDVTIDEAREVVRKIKRGDLQPVPDFREEQTGAIIRKYARDARTPTSVSTTEPDRKRRSNAGIGGSVMGRIEALLSKGLSSREAAEQLCPCDHEDSRPWERYGCQICQDAGFAIIHNPKSADMPYTTRAAIACACKAGDQYVSATPQRGKWTSRYSSKRHTLWEQPEAEFREQMARLRAESVKAMPNYSKELAEWGA